MPYTTVQKKLLGIQHINNITASAYRADQVDAVVAAITTELRVQHQLVPGEPDDFMVRSLEEMASVRTESLRTMTTLLAAIAGVSLLVGGIGIMNIMLVSVTERTREIGLRMAVGARGRDVLTQFLVEAVLISLIGGTIGIGLGFGVSEAVRRVLEWPSVVRPGRC
jgi:putative ABC transport system permease protein